MDGRELKAYERFKEQAQLYRAIAYDREAELRVVRPQLYRAGVRIGRLEERVEKLSREKALLEQRVADLTAELKHKPAAAAAAVPAFVKPNVPPRKGRK